MTVADSLCPPLDVVATHLTEDNTGRVDQAGHSEGET